MDPLEDVVANLVAHRARLVQDLARVEAALAALRSDGEQTSSGAPMVDRVIELFEENPMTTFTAESALDLLKEQGWESDAVDPLNAMRTTLSRMARRGEVRRVDRGLYRAQASVRFTDPWAKDGSVST